MAERAEIANDLRERMRRGQVERRHDAVNSPRHYTSSPSGVEAIDVVEHMTFNVGNAVKYLWRCGLKGEAVEDLKKARWYVDREIAKREKEQKKP